MRDGLPDASGLRSPTEFLVGSYENCGLRPAGANASAAMAFLMHLRQFDIKGRFVIMTSLKKLHSWKVLVQQTPGVCSRLLVCETAADFQGAMSSDDGRLDVVIVSYACAARLPKHPNPEKHHRFAAYIILDEARQYMWRPDLARFFDPARSIWDDNAHLARNPLFVEKGSNPALLLDDFHCKPCTLFELFHLVWFTWHGDRALIDRSRTDRNLQDDNNNDDLQLGPLGWQASIMELLDPFGFSDAVNDKVLRPQLEAALRHSMCRA